MSNQKAEIDEDAPYTTFNPYTALDYRDDVAKRDRQQQNRLSSAHSISNLPEVVTDYAGKEVVQGEGKEAIASHDEKELAYSHDGKEVTSPEKEIVHLEHLPETYDEEKGKEIAPAVAPVDPEKGDVSDLQKTDPSRPATIKERLDRRCCGLRIKWIVLIVVLLLVLIIAIGAGVGASASSSSGGASKAEDTSPAGALPGTKLAVVSQSAGSGGGETLVMYFQHQTGSIRWMELADNGTWVGGDESTVVANDAKNHTAISAVSYDWDGASFWRVYYIDKTNKISEVWKQDSMSSWTLGPLNDQNVSPLNDDKVGMMACWAGTTSGNEGKAEASNSQDLVIRLAYAEDATTFKLLSYTGLTQQYNTEQTLSKLNGRAKPACYNWAPGTVDYMMFVDLQNSVEVYWRDSGSGQSNSTDHPYNKWTNTSVEIPNVNDQGTLTYADDNMFAQGAFDHLIGGYNITFAAENTTAATWAEYSIHDNAGIPGTGLSSTVHDGEVMVFFQTLGMDLIEYRRGVNAGNDGEWTGTVIHVPTE